SNLSGCGTDPCNSSNDNCMLATYGVATSIATAPLTAVCSTGDSVGVDSSPTPGAGVIAPSYDYTLQPTGSSAGALSASFTNFIDSDSSDTVQMDFIDRTDIGGFVVEAGTIGYGGQSTALGIHTEAGFVAYSAHATLTSTTDPLQAEDNNYAELPAELTMPSSIDVSITIVCAQGS
ncbi:MAG: hypothetical protein ABSA40_11310, partial [Candidatus Dormibacteria bacterium]